MRDILGDYSSSFYMGGGCILGAGVLMTLSHVLIHSAKQREQEDRHTDAGDKP